MQAKALQECPNAGTLWAECVSMAPRPQRKSKSVDALRRCDNDPHVINAVAQLFWHDRKVQRFCAFLVVCGLLLTLDRLLGQRF
jgi:pre-mRNA-processing factor 6